MINIKHTGNEIVISLKNRFVFLEGTPFIRDNVEDVLFELSDILHKILNQIDIVNAVSRLDERNKESISLSINRTLLIAKVLKDYGNKSNINTLIKYVNSEENTINIVIHDYVE